MIEHKQSGDCESAAPANKPANKHDLMKPACGHWCIFYAARILGIPTDVDKAVGSIPGPAPHDLSEIANGLDRLGLKWKALKMDYPELCQAQMPIICHLAPEHFSTVVSADSERVVLYEPSETRVQLTAAEFTAKWSGNTLCVFRPSEDMPASDGPRIRFNSLMKDGGEVSESGGLIEFTYDFVNSGKQDVKIDDVKTSCRCVEAVAPPIPVGPGEHGAITLRYRADVNPGAFRYITTLRTNDPELLVTQLVATGYVSGFIRIAPGHLDLGKVTVGENTVRDLRIVFGGGPGTIKAVSCNTSSVCVDYRLLDEEEIIHECKITKETVVGLLGDGGKVLRLRMAFQQPGAASGDIIITTNLERFATLVVPFKAEVSSSDGEGQ